MLLNYYYYYFKGALPQRFCDHVLKHGCLQPDSLARIGKFSNTKDLTPEELKNLKKERDASVVWLTDKWIYKTILPFVRNANKEAQWGFDIDLLESIQFTKYKPNQFYDWHCDSWPKPYNLPNNPSRNGKIRKLSVICSLSDPSEYEGGTLEFDLRNDQKEHKTIECKEIITKGSVVVFPSFVWHRVKPVTKGTRYSLVLWSLGQPFK
tara:strand:- start:4889 stop:5512 length:624 start_codon:yes stop_codon:yes gene_type:complete